MGGLLLLLSCSEAVQAADYLRIQDVTGGSVAPDHEGWIEVNTVQQSHAGQASVPSGALGGVFAVSKLPDRATPKLAEAAADGRVFSEIELEIDREIGGRRLLYRIILRNANVIYFLLRVDATAAPYEYVGFLFEEIEWTYVELHSSGKPLANHRAYWDYLRGVGGSETERVGFVVQGQPSETGGLALEWEAAEGRAYRVFRTLDLSAPFQPLLDIAGGSAGPRTFNLPGTGELGFYYIEELPE